MNQSAEFAKIEFKKALIFAPQVVLNRAFALNTPLVTQMLSSQSEDRPHLIKLLNDHSIVLYAWDNQDPMLKAEAAMQISEQGREAWIAACGEASPQCVRFSWDDGADAVAREAKLSKMFQQRIKNLAEVNARSVALAIDSNINKLEIEGLEILLARLSEHSRSEYITRSSIYEELIWKKQVIADGDRRRFIDYDIYGVRAFKQLVDLIYCTNLSDSLQIAPLSPAGSMDRSLLSESAEVGTFVEMGGEQAARVIYNLYTRIRSAEIKTFPFDQMSLEHILKIREHGAWSKYNAAKLHLSAISGNADPDKFESELTERFQAANLAYVNLCSACHKEFARYYVLAPGLVQNAARTTYRYGGFLLGAVVDSILQSGGAATGGGYLADQMLDKFKNKLGQTIESKFAFGLGGASQMVFGPRIGWKDNQTESTKFFAELKKLGFGNEGTDGAEVAPQTATTTGYELTTEAPDYG